MEYTTLEHPVDHASEQQTPKDHDGKSKSASAVDGAHYPSPDNQGAPHDIGTVAHDDIATRAYQMWENEGCPPHCSERHWLDAERELKSEATSRKMVERAHENSGSVQR